MKRLGDKSLLARQIICLAALSSVCVLAAAEQLRYHGLQLDEQYEVMLEQNRGAVDVILVGRESPPGGPIEHTNGEGKTDTAYRVDKREILVRLKVEVLRPAPPNYLSNPGLRYRLTILGESLEPDLAIIHEVADTEMRKVLVGEFAAIGARAGGLYREAMHSATLLALGVLKASGYLPAEVPMTIEKSTVGQIRGLGEGLTRQSLPAGRNINPVSGTPPVAPHSRVDLTAPLDITPNQGYLGRLPNTPAAGSIPPATIDTHIAEVGEP